MHLSESETAPESRILCVGGSPRKGGNTDAILQAFTKGLPDETPSEAIKLRDYRFDPCIGCERCRRAKRCEQLKDGMQLLYPKIIASQGLVLVCPTHNYNVTAWMKAFIDRLYCFYNFTDGVPRSWSSRLAGQNRKAAIIAICEQNDKKDMGFTLEAMRMPLEALGYDIIDELAVFRIFKAGGVKEDLHAMERVHEISGKMARALDS